MQLSGAVSERSREELLIVVKYADECASIGDFSNLERYGIKNLSGKRLKFSAMPEDEDGQSVDAISAAVSAAGRARLFRGLPDSWMTKRFSRR
jgi:hypothetical protein